MITSLYYRFFCYTSSTQKYHHYQPIKSPKFLDLYYYKCNNVSLFNPTLAGATVLTLRMQQARQTSNTNFITAMVSGKYRPTKELKMKQPFTCVWWTWLGQIVRKVNDFTSFNPLDNDKNGMTLQSKIFFRKRQMPMRIIWDRKNFSKSGWGPKIEVPSHNVPQWSANASTWPVKLYYEQDDKCFLVNNQQSGRSGKTEPRILKDVLGTLIDLKQAQDRTGFRSARKHSEWAPCCKKGIVCCKELLH